MIRGLMMDVRALLYGPSGADLLSQILRNESIEVDPAAVTDALERLPQELRGFRQMIRTEEQENDYNRAMLPALLQNLGVTDPTQALLMRLVETLYGYHAYYSLYPETLPVLAELQRRGVQMAVVANWEPSLHRLLQEFELDGYFTSIAASAVEGVTKPDPILFHRVLKAMGLSAAEVAHVGPSLTEDASGAAAAGITPIWLNRTGITTGHEVLTITDLRGLLLLVQEAEH